MIKINGIEVVGDYFAYDGCHKIYILEDEKDRLEMLFPIYIYHLQSFCKHKS